MSDCLSLSEFFDVAAEPAPSLYDLIKTFDEKQEVIIVSASSESDWKDYVSGWVKFIQTEEKNVGGDYGFLSHDSGIGPI